MNETETRGKYHDSCYQILLLVRVIRPNAVRMGFVDWQRVDYDLLGQFVMR